MIRRITLAVAAVLGCAVLLAPVARAAEVQGAGSTLAYTIIWKWADSFRKRTGDVVGYDSIGSSAGVSRIKAGAVDFAATDRPLPPEELERLGLGQFPIVFGGVVPVVNLAGVGPGQIRFTGPLLADIYLGKVAKWSDPAITALNPGLALPDADIIVVHRSEGSGTTFNWVSFLAKASPQWKRTVGEGSDVDWPVGHGVRGNEGVAMEVRRVPNAIGYVDYSFVVQAKLTYGLVQNRAGRFIAPGTDSFQAAALSFDWKDAKDFFVLINDSAAEAAYPIAATTFALMYRLPKAAGRSRLAFDFWRFALGEGGTFAPGLGYVPLPPALVGEVKDYWKLMFHEGS